MYRQILAKFQYLKVLNSSTINKHLIFRHFSHVNTGYLGVNYEPDFTEEQTKFLLKTLNEATTEELARFNLSKNRIKKIDTWRKKNGVFHNLTDVLDVDGLGVKMLDRLCKNIIEGDSNTEDVKEKPVKARGNILTPAMSANKIKDLESTLGLHFYATGLSWARIGRENNSLTHWDFVDYNTNAKKLSPSDALQIILKVGEKLPPSDVYIFEAPVSVTPTAQQSSISVTAYAQRVQLLSMLMTVLTTSALHNPRYSTNGQNSEGYDVGKTDIKNGSFVMEPNVYFLRHRLPARLFRTLVGNERVSSAATVSNILTTAHYGKIHNYTPLLVSEDLKGVFESEQPVYKEVLGQALFLSMAFMEVCVYQNPKSIKAISSNRS